MCIETGLIGLVVFDLIGLVVGRTIFDHGSHLGGAGFGYFYGPIRVGDGIVKWLLGCIVEEVSNDPYQAIP